MLAASFPRVSIVGTRITASTFEEALNWLAEAVHVRCPVVMCPATVYSVMLAHYRPDYQVRVNQADYVMADGVPLVWALRLRGQPAERVHGDDFMLAVCARFPTWRHFLLGGAIDQPERVSAELCRRFPEIQIVGRRATPARPVPADETAEIINAIHACNAEVVWVGMGTPTQDEWMLAHVATVGVPLVGVGSVFDLLSGRTRPVPEWVKRGGFQWLLRWMQEPRRLARRYLLYNPLFIWHFTLQYLGLKQY